MLYCRQFKSYKDFRERFGYKTDVNGNYLLNNHGVPQRKNVIPYILYKTSLQYFQKVRKFPLHAANTEAYKVNNNKEALLKLIEEFKVICPWEITLDSISLYSPKELSKYKLIDDGCTPDLNINNVYCSDAYDRKVSIKIGKYLQDIFNHIIDLAKSPIYLRSYPILYLLQNHVLSMFLIEELAEIWKKQCLKDFNLKLNVSDDFDRIYSLICRDQNNSDFRSCMDDKPNWQFYQNHNDIFKAVSLVNSEGNIYARALLIKCYDSDNQEHLLLERIYYNKRVYQQRLFDLVRQSNICDLYKNLEASCREATFISNIKDNSLFDDKLHINLDLKHNDFISYQDTFKFYYPDLRIASNVELYGKHISLATTALHYSESREII